MKNMFTNLSNTRDDYQVIIALENTQAYAVEKLDP